MTSGMMNKKQITAFTASTAAGIGNQALLESLKAKQTGLSPCTFLDIKGIQAYTGEINNLSSIKLPDTLLPFTCRNNQLAELALNQDNFIEKIEDLKNRTNKTRIGVFMGTSTSGIEQTEQAYKKSYLSEHLPDWYHYAETQNLYSLADFVCNRLKLAGVSQVISTACSSSAKVFASASRAIDAGLCDAAIVGGVDTLCLTTLFGFNALQLVDSDICRPCDTNRAGLSIGEGAGFAILEQPNGNSPFCLSGFGETSDAYHMSSPHPKGAGAALAMNYALTMADIKANEVDYINLHGTGTPTNDKAECLAIAKIFRDTPVSSTKGWTGHTLGAAGIIEAIISLLTLSTQHLPANLNLKELDPNIKVNVLQESIQTSVNKVLSNSFGFGGSNASLLFENF